MNCTSRKGTVLRGVLLCALICLTSLLSGCRLNLAGTDVQTNHVFVGQPPVRGAVQVAQNKSIRVISLDEKGAPHVEDRDCGQFVLMTPWDYQQLVRDAAAGRQFVDPKADK